MSEKWTKAPWNICWATFDGRKVNFDITASPYGSVRPIAGSKWKTDWSDVEGEELIANAHLIASAPAMAEALEKAKDALVKIRACSVAGASEGYTKPEVWGEALFASHADVHAALSQIEAALSLARGEAK